MRREQDILHAREPVSEPPTSDYRKETNLSLQLPLYIMPRITVALLLDANHNLTLSPPQRSLRPTRTPIMRYQEGSSQPSQNPLHRYYHANGAKGGKDKDRAPYALVTGSSEYERSSLPVHYPH